LKILLNRSGTDIRAYPATLEGTIADGLENLIIARVPDDVVIGAGDSGSPLTTEDGRIIGILCYGAMGANQQFWARAIADVLTVPSIRVSTPLKKISKANLFHSMPLSFQISGADPAFIKRLPTQFQQNYFYSSAVNGSSLPKLMKNNSESQPQIMPGMSVALWEVSGDIINFYAIGTISYRDDSLLHAFGHPYSYKPSRQVSKPVSLASMQTMLESNFISYKIAQGRKEIIGEFTGEGFEGITIELCDTVPTIKVTVETILDDQKKKLTHHVSYDIDKSWEEMLLETVLSQSVSHRFNFQKNSGWAQVSLSMELPDTTLSEFYTVGDSDSYSIENSEYEEISYESSWGYDDDGLAHDIAEEAVEYIYYKNLKPFAIKNIHLEVTLHPNESLEYIDSDYIYE